MQERKARKKKKKTYGTGGEDREDYASIQRLHEQDLSTTCFSFTGERHWQPASADNQFLEARRCDHDFFTKRPALADRQTCDIFVRVSGEVNCARGLSREPGDTLPPTSSNARGAHFALLSLLRLAVDARSRPARRGTATPGLHRAEMQRELTSRYGGRPSGGTTSAAEQQMR